MYYELTDEFVVAADADRTWAFFSRAENLPEITPPWMNFSIASPTPIDLHVDSTIDYTIRWMGLPIRWRTRIIDWSPPGQFIDLQIRGPYTLWHHQHTFTPAADGSGTQCRDRVIYKLPGAGVGRVVNALMVKRQLLGIFEYRQREIARLLGAVTMIRPPTVMAVG
jgi:ligand-binding SRPBCC domain-containing protein